MKTTLKPPKPGRKIRLKKLNPKKHLGHNILDLRGTLVVAAISFIVLAGTTLYTVSYLKSGQMAAVIGSVLVDLTNNDRASQNLSPLTVSAALTAAAQAKANDMVANGYFAHTSPDGKNSWYWFKLEGYSFSYAGENLAVDFTDSDAVDKAWMNSPEHRANILDPNFTQIGIATATGTYEGHTAIFVVQMFGTPATGSTGAVEAVNPAPAATELAVAKTVPAKPAVLAAAAVKPAPEPSTTPTTNVVADTETDTDLGSAPVIPDSSPFWGFVATSPETLLRDIYLVIGGIILIALLSITGFEFQRHHMKHVYAALLLFVIMTTLYVAADTLIFKPPALAEASYEKAFD